MKNLSIFVLLILIESIHLAPVDDDKKVYSLLKNDKRFEKLYFIKECEFENKPICSALIDIALRFNETKLEFAKETISVDDEFCHKQLLKQLPEKPKSEETLALLKKYSIAWFKDKLNRDEESCNLECIYTDNIDYTKKPKPVCVFIYNQYKLLESNSKAVENKILEKANSANNVSSGEQTQQQKTLVAVNDNSNSKTTNPQVLQQQTSINIESEAGGGLIDVVPAHVDNIKSTVPTAVVNKSEQEQPASTNVESKPQESAEKPVLNVKNVPLEPEKVESASPATVSSNKSDTTQNKDETKPSGDLESELDDHRIFDNDGETQQTDKDQDIDMNGELGDDDEEYAEPLARDNNRNDINAKFTQDVNDIDGSDSDSVPHVQSIPFQEDPDSNFFTYLCITMFLSILLYILYHNRQKLLALLLEGRRGSRRSRERSRGGSKAAYSKLDCNLEEAITSKKSLSGKSMDIIY